VCGCCAAASLPGFAICRSSATGGGGVSCCGAATSLRCAVSTGVVASFCCVVSTAGAVAADRFSVKACSDAPSAADGTSTVTALETWGPAAHGMPRRDKQLRSSCHHSCCWQDAAGGSEISVLATSNSSRASGNNASTPTRLAAATREARATKRKFEYKAHLLRSEIWPPFGAKTTPLWRDYVRARELVQRKLKPCLTVGRGEKGVFCKGDGSPGRLRADLASDGDQRAPQAPPAGTIRAKASRRARPQAQPRRRALLDDLAAEAEQRRRPPPGRGRGLAGRLDQGRGFNQAAEILLVQVAPRDRLHRALQLGEGELARHQLEYDGTVFELGAQPRDRGGEDAAVIEAHGLAQPGHGLPRHRGFAAVAARFLGQAGLVDELVAVEHLLLVPWAAAEREAQAYALAAAERARRRGLGRAARPI